MPIFIEGTSLQGKTKIKESNVEPFNMAAATVKAQLAKPKEPNKATEDVKKFLKNVKEQSETAIKTATKDINLDFAHRLGVLGGGQGETSSLSESPSNGSSMNYHGVENSNAASNNQINKENLDNYSYLNYSVTGNNPTSSPVAPNPNNNKFNAAINAQADQSKVTSPPRITNANPPYQNDFRSLNSSSPAPSVPDYSSMGDETKYDSRMAQEKWEAELERAKKEKRWESEIERIKRERKQREEEEARGSKHPYATRVDDPSMYSNPAYQNAYDEDRPPERPHAPPVVYDANCKCIIS